MHKLTGKQCRMARALLKWNVYDLASHVNGINPKRIESFERGTVHTAEWENKEMVSAFRKEGVQFNDEMDVTLASDKKKSSASHSGGGSGQGAVIKLDGDMEIISDTSIDSVQGAHDLLGEEDEKKKKK